ncbi:MAG: (2Fe-2S)-binding protein [Planctomycetota bacterium]
MNDDDHVCLCFHVSKRKVVSYCRRERPPVASLISECLSAGTGCGWCVPHLRSLHAQVMEGDANPDLPLSTDAYAAGRAEHQKAKGSPTKPTD